MDSWNTTQMVHQRLMIVFYGPPIGVKTCRVRSETNGTRACNDSVQLAPALRPAAAENSSCIHVFRFVYTNKLRVSAVLYVPSVCAVMYVPSVCAMYSFWVVRGAKDAGVTRTLVR